MASRLKQNIFGLIVFVILFTVSGVFAEDAGGGFEYDQTTIKREAAAVIIEGVMINESGETFEQANFVVTTLDFFGGQNGFGTCTIPEFSSDQPRNFQVQINLFDNLHVDDYKIEFKGGKRKE